MGERKAVKRALGFSFILVYTTTGSAVRAGNVGGARAQREKEAFPDLPTGTLTYAQLGPLPSNMLLRAETVEITAGDLGKAIEAAWYAPAEQLRELPFFVLEQEAAQKILLVLARKEWTKSETKGKEPSETELVEAFLRKAIGTVEVTDSEITDFY